MEHVDIDCAKWVFQETYRILKPGGIFWIVVPDAELLLQKYKDNDVDFFNSMGFMGRPEWENFGVETNLENRLLHFYVIMTMLGVVQN